MNKLPDRFSPKSARQFSPKVSSVPKPSRSAWMLLTACVGSGLILFGMALWVSLNTRKVTHFRADDLSKSAIQPLQAQRQEHCRASNQQYQSGDRLITIAFADQSEVTSTAAITNVLELPDQCQMPKIPDSLGHESGTSLIRLLERIQVEITNQRKLGNSEAMVVTITLQDTEPGIDQPNTEDFERLKRVLTNLDRNRAVVAIIGVSGKLQNDLQTQLSGTSNVQVCPKTAVKSCVDWAFKTGRKL